MSRVFGSGVWCLLIRSRLARTVSLPRSVLVDRGSNVRAETKDWSRKSHMELFCSLEHREKTDGAFP